MHAPPLLCVTTRDLPPRPPKPPQRHNASLDHPLPYLVVSAPAPSGQSPRPAALSSRHSSSHWQSSQPPESESTRHNPIQETALNFSTIAGDGFFYLILPSTHLLPASESPLPGESGVPGAPSDDLWPEAARRAGIPETLRGSQRGYGRTREEEQPPVVLADTTPLRVQVRRLTQRHVFKFAQSESRSSDHDADKSDCARRHRICRSRASRRP